MHVAAVPAGVYMQHCVPVPLGPQVGSITPSVYTVTEMYLLSVQLHNNGIMGLRFMLFCFCDLDLDPMTFTYVLDLYPLKVYPQTKNAHFRSRLSKVIITDMILPMRWKYSITATLQVVTALPCNDQRSYFIFSSGTMA